MNQNCKRYFVFVKSAYIRDAQMFCGSSVDDEALIDDDENYRDICGDVLVMDICEPDFNAVIERIKKMYQGAALDIFTVYEVADAKEYATTFLSAVRGVKL